MYKLGIAFKRVCNHDLNKNKFEPNSSQSKIQTPNRAFKNYYSAFHPLMFHYVFLCQLQGPSWAVGSHSSSPPAGGNTQILILKTL